MTASKIALPKVVSHEEWQKSRQELLAKEKKLTRALDALAAERRRLPMVPVEDDYAFTGPGGEASLIDLFHGRRQLIVYCAMLEPGAAPCVGCSMVMDNVGHNLSHVNARDATFVFTSPAPQNEIIALQSGWAGTLPGTLITVAASPTPSMRGRGLPSTCSFVMMRIAYTAHTSPLIAVASCSTPISDCSTSHHTAGRKGGKTLPKAGRKPLRMSGGVCTTNTALSRAYGKNRDRFIFCAYVDRHHPPG